MDEYCILDRPASFPLDGTLLTHPCKMQTLTHGTSIYQRTRNQLYSFNGLRVNLGTGHPRVQLGASQHSWSPAAQGFIEMAMGSAGRAGLVLLLITCTFPANAHNVIK